MARITVVFGDESIGVHAIKHHPFVVGRESSCDITIDNVGVSREHCRFVHDGRHFFIEDMGSANGTFHHGHKIRKASIGDGDKIQIGKFTLTFNQAAGEEPPPAKGAEPEPSAAGGQGDRMVTFMMDPQKLRAKMEDQPSGPQRAGDVARAMGGPAPTKHLPSVGGMTGAMKAVIALGVIALLAIAAAVILAMLGKI